MSGKSIAVLLAVITVAVHAQIVSYTKLERQTELVRLLDQKSKIDSDQIRDLLYELRAAQSKTEAERSGAYVAGILDAMDRPDHYREVWHDGYDRGQDVRQQSASPSEVAAAEAK